MPARGAWGRCANPSVCSRKEPRSSSLKLPPAMLRLPPEFQDPWPWLQGVCRGIGLRESRRWMSPWSSEVGLGLWSSLRVGYLVVQHGDLIPEMTVRVLVACKGTERSRKAAGAPQQRRQSCSLTRPGPGPEPGCTVFYVRSPATHLPNTKHSWPTSSQLWPAASNAADTAQGSQRNKDIHSISEKHA